LRLRRRYVWHPVLDPRAFDRGDIIWVDSGSHHGYNEVRALGQRELLLRHIPWWEVWLRRIRGRARRWWIRNWRR
jgi:hypothetical protein